MHTPQIPALADKSIALRVDLLVRRLLDGADRVRWLSLANRLPALAEASPEEFLAAVEKSLDAPDVPVLQLIAESSEAGLFSQCWHAGLLWALELLGWAPQRLVRVSVILGRLSEARIAQKWGNTPANSLLDFYRPWFPQTGATIDQRIAALDILIKRTPQAAAALIDSLVEQGLGSCTHTARPRWRDDDAGAGYGATREEQRAMETAAAALQIEIASRAPDQLCDLIKNFSVFEPGQREKIGEALLLDETADDETKEQLRAALRDKIHWHRAYDETEKSLRDAYLAPLDRAYAHLTPDNLQIRHAWLFAEGQNWIDLPIENEGDDFRRRDEVLQQWRSVAVAEIFGIQGWQGICALAERSRGGWPIGWTMADMDVDHARLIEWIANDCGDLHRDVEATHIAAGMMRRLRSNSLPDIVERVLAAAAARPVDWKVRLLCLFSEEPRSWDIAAGYGPEAEQSFWESCPINLWHLDDSTDRNRALSKLIDAKRPLTALRGCHIKFTDVDPELVARMLEGVIAAEEEASQLPQPHYFQHAIDHLETSGAIDEGRLVRIEFTLIKALGYRGEGHAKSLYRAITSQAELFVELLTFIYNPRNGPKVKAEGQREFLGTTAWQVLHACTRIPGTRDNGRIDRAALFEFVADAKKLAAECDRLEACEDHIGQILAHAPVGEDGIFPCEPVRDLLEEHGTSDIESGFYAGCMNKRGVTSRGIFDGGDQERGLARFYRDQSDALSIAYPRAAQVLRGLADAYVRHGKWEDNEARLRREGA